MTQPLVQHIKRFVPLSESDELALLSHSRVIDFKKKAYVFEEGKRCHANYFVVKGLARLLCLDKTGGEQTVQFALENWWITVYNSMNKSIDCCQFSLQPLEDLRVVALTYNELELLYEKVPQLERYFRLVFQKSIAAFQIRNKYMLCHSGEEFYNLFLTLLPEFVQRVPQRILASYLGITPQFLSRIRGRRQ